MSSNRYRVWRRTSDVGASLAPVGTTPARALARLEQAAASGALDDVARRHQLGVLTVFGSAARRDPTARDLDVAVAFSPGAPDLLALLDELSALTGSDDVDLLDLGSAGPVARERALVGCVALYESEHGLVARMRGDAIVQRMDTDWLRRLDLDLLAR